MKSKLFSECNMYKVYLNSNEVQLGQRVGIVEIVLVE